LATSNDGASATQDAIYNAENQLRNGELQTVDVEVGCASPCQEESQEESGELTPSIVDALECGVVVIRARRLEITTVECSIYHEANITDAYTTGRALDEPDWDGCIR
jgi:hypothetical protein